MTGRWLALGCYTAESEGHGSGISLCSFDDRTGELTLADTLELASPSWLQWHPRLPVLYASNEVADGAVTVVAVRAGRLHQLGTAATGGALPCHLVITGDGRQLYAANYGGGSLAGFALDAVGGLGERTELIAHHGTGPDPDRQDGPHVHMIVLDAADELVSAVDLGIDQIRSYRRTSQGLTPAAVTELAPGTGPRQLVRNRHTGRAYLVAELAASLLTLDETSPGSFAVRDSVTASEQPIRNLPAQFSLSADGRFGYLSNRYPDSIAVFSLTGDTPVRLAEYPTGPGWPRHFALTGNWLIAANQHGDQLIVFAVEDGGARLREVRRYPAGTPTCVALR
ncbi:MAG: lactonase family protein [Jatrophihabitans sp.]